MSTPISRMMAMEASRMTWYSLSERVWIGATVMLSPVWTPMGSRFSMEQMITTLSARSRITSSSYSFHPTTDSSIITWFMRLASRPPADRASSSACVWATPPPVPPRVKLGRTIRGRPISSAMARTWSMLVAMPLLGMRRPMLFMAFRNRSRSSAFLMAESDAPIISTLNFSSTPISATATAVFRPVWPPRVGRMAQGRSFSMMAATASGVTGSM